MTPMKLLFHCRWLFCVTTVAFLTFPPAGTAGMTKNGNPWDKAFLTAPASELLTAANAVPASEKDEAVVLLDEGTFSLDAEGRCVSRYRMAYRILNRAGVEEWSSIAAAWSPWHEERPVLHARVVTPDGAEHVLSGETIEDSPTRESSPNIYSDHRKVRAPLPALAVGAVVEQEIVIREKAPFFAAGTIHRFFFGRSARVLTTRVVIDSPAELPIKYVTRLLPHAAVNRRNENGRIYLTVESGPMEPVEDAEPDMPANVPRYGNVAFTTGKRWNDVAEQYGEIVDRRIASGDLGDLVKETVGETKDRCLIAARLLERLRREVRYTGVQFGSSSIVPAPPEETLRHKYGDCKDQAALLIKMLRTAGVPASMALIRSGMGEDVEQDLPGLGDFDHAIVYLPGKPDLWIDPTNSFRPAGELPLDDQGRLALIADGTCSALIVTPTAPSKENRQVETREFYLSESGTARVVETTSAWGSIGAAFRKDYSESDDKTIREKLGEYARSAYLAEQLSNVENSSPKEVAGPFRLRLEMNKASRGFTDDDEAVVALSTSFLTERLPSPLTEPDKNSDGNRTHDYLIPEPYVYEARYRIAPPPGFAAQALPESGATRFGPMSLSRDFRMEKDGTVSVILRFDTVKRRLTPAEFAAARDSLQTLRKEKTTLVRFEQVGRALLAAGKHREALEEFRRLSRLHPAEALHHDQVARTLMEIGLGNEARKEAERAVAVEPNSPAAHRALAWVLQHDDIGRFRRKGFERNRAIAEYRKAKALDPRDYYARGDLAILLEFNADAERYGPGADLAGAIEEYRAIRTDLKRTDLDENLMIALYRSKKWKELKELAGSLEPSETRTKYLLLAVAGQDGAATALQQARRDIPDPASRRKTLEILAASLIHVRRYRDAANLYREAAKGAPNAVELGNRINMLKNIRYFDEIPLPEGSPATVIKRMLLSLFVPESAADTYISLFARPVREAFDKKGSDREIRMIMDYLSAKVRKESDQLPREVMADSALSNLEFFTEGNDVKGYRIEISLPSSPKEKAMRFFVIKEKGKYRVVTSSVTPDLIGMEVLRRVESGDRDGAKTWLDWAREEIRPARDDDPLAEEPFLGVWPKGSPADPVLMRLSAACLLSGSGDRRVIPILLKGRENATGNLRTTIDMALADAYLTEKRFADLLPVCDRLAKDHPDSTFPFMLRCRTLMSMNRVDEAIALAEARLAGVPKDPVAMRALAFCCQQQGNLAKAEEYYRTLMETGAADESDYNNLAWLGLFRPSIDDEYLSLAERSVALTNGNNGASLHTLSAVYAEMGKTAEARETIMKKIELSDMEKPSSGDWYVLGRISEQYGEKGAAVELYRKVGKPGPGDAESISAYTLARKRLSHLGGEKGDI